VKAESIMTSPVITVRPSISIKQAGRVLIDNEISAAPVVDDTGRLVGIVTEADVMRLETEDDPRDRVRRSEAADPYVPVTVGEIMSRNVLAVSPETDAGEIARLMLEQQVKCVPIVHGDKVVGVVSRRDLLRALVRRDQDIRADLESLLLEEPETYGRWSVEVEDGVVTLVGPPDRFRRRLAGIVSHTVPGVLGVRFRAAGHAMPSVRVGPDGEPQAS
jgi:CBS domain-containing protein